jgi:hypothetical protein
VDRKNLEYIDFNQCRDEERVERAEYQRNQGPYFFSTENEVLENRWYQWYSLTKAFFVYMVNWQIDTGKPMAFLLQSPVNNHQ